VTEPPARGPEGFRAGGSVVSAGEPGSPPRRFTLSNGGTEAINLIIEKTRRLARGFRTFTHYRILLAASGTRPWRTNHA
jgi:hypothetical protein